MNGSGSGGRYNNSSESTLDTLNRTITDLENKILGRASAVDHHGLPAAQDDTTTLADQIRSRQKALARARVNRQSRPTIAQPTSSQPSPFGDPSPRAPRAPSFSSHQSGAPASRENETRPMQPDLASVLNQLRVELKNDVAATVRNEVGHLRGEMQQVASDPNVPASVGQDLEQIAQSLKQLETSSQKIPNTSDNNVLDSLRLEVDSLRTLVDGLAKEEHIVGLDKRWTGEVDHLRSMVGGLAREDSLIGLDRRWSDIEQSLKGFDHNAIQGELGDLSARLEDVRAVLSQMDNGSAALEPLESKVEAISHAIVELMERPVEQFDPTQFSALTTQTEDRLGELFERVEQIASQTQNQGQPELAGHIENLSARLGNIATEDTILSLEERIANLQSSMGGDVDTHMPQINERLKNYPPRLMRLISVPRPLKLLALIVWSDSLLKLLKGWMKNPSRLQYLV